MAKLDMKANSRLGVVVKRVVALLVLLSADCGCARPGGLAAASPEEAGLVWRECEVSGFDLAQAEAGLGEPRPFKSEAERARVGTRTGSGLRLTIGDDSYETRHLGLGIVPGWPWDPYLLLKNGRPASLLFGEFEVYDPDLSLREIAGQAAWEFADAHQATVIYGGRDLRGVYGLQAAYAPYELEGRLAFIGKRDGRYFLVYDGRQVGPAFDDVTIAYCCEIMLYSAGGGEGRYRFWGQRSGQMYVVEVTAAPLPRSMKGYELYSWREGEVWRFTLITGTNRNKSYDEITADGDTVSAEGWVKITVTGVDALKATLARLPKGEFVAWDPAGWWMRVVAPQENPGQPDQAMVEEIRAFCRQAGLEMAGP